MATIAPFRGWRYNANATDPALAACPYAVLSDADLAAECYRRHPRNLARIVPGRGFEFDNPADNCLTRAAAHLDQWRSDGVFLQDRPALYLYQQSFEFFGRKYFRRGFFCRLLLGEYGEQNLVPLCPAGQSLDVTRLDRLRALRGYAEPAICVLADGLNKAFKIADGVCGFKTAVMLRDDNGVEHRLWVMDHEDNCEFVKKYAAEAKVFFSQGTSLYEAARCYRNEVREAMRTAGQIPPAIGELDCDYVLALLLLDSDQGLTEWPVAQLREGIDHGVALCREEYDRPPREGEAGPVHEVCERRFYYPLPPLGMVLDLFW